MKATNLDPTDIQFVEAHGTGTQVGDPIEASAIEAVYCTEGRKEPLYVGSVKSNLGHSEAPAGMYLEIWYFAVKSICNVFYKYVLNHIAKTSVLRCL